MFSSTGFCDWRPNTFTISGKPLGAFANMVPGHSNVNRIALNPDKRYIGVNIKENISAKSQQPSERSHHQY
jgi:hypothetical protein